MGTHRTVTWLRRSLGLVAVAGAAVWAFSELLLLGPQAQIAAWERRVEPPSTESIESTYRLLQTVARLQPWDADVALLRGQVALRRATALGKADAEWLSIAQADMAAALRLRPAWVRAWGWYGLAQRERANLLGPSGSLVILRHLLPVAMHENDNYEVFARLGYSHWQLLGPGERQQLDTILERYYWIDHVRALTLAHRFNRLELFAYLGVRHHFKALLDRLDDAANRARE